MAEILRPDANVPVELRLRYAGSGKPVQGQYGPQVMYTVEDRAGGVRTLYLDPTVATKIDMLDLAVGQPFLLCKRQSTLGGRKQTEWEVSRIDRPGDARPPVTKVTDHAYAIPASATGATPISTPPISTPAQTGPAALMADCLRQAVDLLATTQKYASERGFPLVTFSAEDIRTTAVSLFIERGREAKIRGAA